MPFTMRNLTTLTVFAIALIVMSACGSSGATAPNVLTPIKSPYLPLVISSDLTVGKNRFVVGLIKQDDNSQVLGASLHLGFFEIDANNQATPKFESDPSVIQITKSYVDTHPDGTHETHQAGDTGAYVSDVTFDAAGNWGVEVTGATKEGVKLDPVRLSFPVLATDPGIAIGSPIPPSRQTIISDVSNIRTIDTSLNPIPDEHGLTVADAIGNGKPTVIAFATPAYCTSLICGPTKDIFDQLYQQYHEQANFIHIEPYDVQKVAAGKCPTLADCTVPATVDFKLESEPWVFVADAHGILRAKFDGIVSEAEMQAALLQVLGASNSPRAVP
jgi:hypothetical protein